MNRYESEFEREWNPYASPEIEDPVDRPVRANMDEPLPCPNCGASGAKPMPYDGWRGRRAPKAIQEVRCVSCRCEFNGETGVAYPPRTSPVVWFLLAAAIFAAYIFLIFVVE